MVLLKMISRLNPITINKILPRFKMEIAPLRTPLPKWGLEMSLGQTWQQPDEVGSGNDMESSGKK